MVVTVVVTSSYRVFILFCFTVSYIAFGGTDFDNASDHFAGTSFSIVC